MILGSKTVVKGRGVCKNVEQKIGDWKVINISLSLELRGVSRDAMAPFIKAHRSGLEEAYHDILQKR